MANPKTSKEEMAWAVEAAKAAAVEAPTVAANSAAGVAGSLGDSTKINSKC